MGGGTSPVVRQNGFAWRDDTAGLNVSTGLTQNSDWNQNADEVFRYRTLLSDTAGATKTSNYTFGLEFQINGTGGFAAVTTSTAIQSVASAQFNDDDVVTSSLVTGTKAGTFVNGFGDENALAPSAGNITLGANHTEVEWALQIDSAQVNNGDTIEIRVPADTVTGATFATITVVETSSINGDAAITEASDSVAATGSVEISGSSAITEASDVVSASGGVEVSGTAAVAEQSDSVSASGGVEVTGDGAITEASDIVAASGTVGDPAINGSAAIIEQPDSVAASGSVETTGNATITESSDSASASGSVEVSGDASITEQSDTVTATGTVGSGAINGDAVIFELTDLVVALGEVEITGAAAIVEASDIVVARSAETPKLGIIRVKVNFRDRRRAAVRQRISIRL